MKKILIKKYRIWESIEFWSMVFWHSLILIQFSNLSIWTIKYFVYLERMKSLNGNFSGTLKTIWPKTDGLHSIYHRIPMVGIYFHWVKINIKCNPQWNLKASFFTIQFLFGVKVHKFWYICRRFISISILSQQWFWFRLFGFQKHFSVIILVWHLFKFSWPP